jgi:predicted Zn-ribbon and HTH transcriptional regulator
MASFGFQGEVETYIITFSIDICSNFKSCYDKIERAIESLGEENDSTFLKVTKTTFLLTSRRKKDYIRNSISSIFSQEKTNGRVLVIEVRLSGWCGYFHDDDIKMVNWIRQNISLDKIK